MTLMIDLTVKFRAFGFTIGTVSETVPLGINSPVSVDRVVFHDRGVKVRLYTK